MVTDQKGEGLLDKLHSSLNKLGIEIETACDIESAGKGLKCVVVAPNLRKSVKEMGDANRDQVVMVRVDSATSKELDAWVATGAVKSRSEAAALFIREGLKVRASELDKLRGALDEVEVAREKLHEKAREVFGDLGLDDADADSGDDAGDVGEGDGEPSPAGQPAAGDEPGEDGAETPDVIILGTQDVPPERKDPPADQES